MFAGGPARISGEAPAGWGGGGAKGPADQECDSFNRDQVSWEEAKQHAKARRQAVCDSQADGLGGVAAGSGQVTIQVPDVSVGLLAGVGWEGSGQGAWNLAVVVVAIAPAQGVVMDGMG